MRGAKPRVWLRPAVIFCLLFLLHLCSRVALADPDTGRLSGKITDPSGAGVAGAHLKLANSAGAVARVATEVFAFPSNPTYPTPIQRVVGVPIKSYVTVSWTYRFRQSSDAEPKWFYDDARSERSAAKPSNPAAMMTAIQSTAGWRSLHGRGSS